MQVLADRYDHNRQQRKRKLHAKQPHPASSIPASIMWHHKHGRMSKEDLARSSNIFAHQKKLSSYSAVLQKRLCTPVCSLYSLAHIIRCGKALVVESDQVGLPLKNWPAPLYKRHSDLVRQINCL